MHLSSPIRSRRLWKALAGIVLAATIVGCCVVVEEQRQRAARGCDTVKGPGDEFDCVSVYFASARALVGDIEFSDLDSDGLRGLRQENPDEEKHVYFSEDFGSEDPSDSLVMGRAVVFMPHLKKADRRSSGGDGDEGRTNLDAVLRSDFAWHNVRIEHVDIAGDGEISVDGQFFKSLDRDMARHADVTVPQGADPEKTALLFVHGFDATYSQNIRQTARLAADLNFNRRDELKDRTPYALGQPMLYTWPTQLTDLSKVPQKFLEGAGLKLLGKTNEKVRSFTTGYGIGREFADEFLEEGGPLCKDKGSLLAVAAKPASSQAMKKAVEGVKSALKKNGVVAGAAGATSAALEAWDGTVDKYLVSTCRAAYAKLGLTEYLKRIVEGTDVETINIVGYSMGAKVTALAVADFAEWFAAEHAGRDLKLNVAQYGADVGFSSYRELTAITDGSFTSIAPAERGISPRTALYSNEDDFFLAVSRIINGEPRVGRHGGSTYPEPFTYETGEDADTVLSHETIDVSRLAKPYRLLSNHALFQRSPELLGDMHCFFGGQDAASRGLDPVNGGKWFAVPLEAGGRKCRGAAWDVGNLDCDSFVAMTAARLQAIGSANQRERVREARAACEDIENDPVKWCKRFSGTPLGIWCPNDDVIVCDATLEADPTAIGSYSFRLGYTQNTLTTEMRRNIEAAVRSARQGNASVEALDVIFDPAMVKNRRTGLSEAQADAFSAAMEDALRRPLTTAEQVALAEFIVDDPNKKHPRGMAGRIALVPSVTPECVALD